MSAQKPAPRRIFIECTHTYLVGGSGGIRRVARNLANAHKGASSDEVELQPLVWAGGRFLSPRKPLTETPHPLMLLGRCVGLVTRAVSAVARWPLLAPLREPIKAGLGKLLQGLRGEQRAAGAGTSEAAPAAQSPECRRSNSDLFYRVFGLLVWPLGFLFVAPIPFRRGDIVVLVDSTWDSPAMLKALFAARGRDGIQVGAMLHDLFPLTLPQMCQASTVAGYTGWFKQAAEGAEDRKSVV